MFYVAYGTYGTYYDICNLCHILFICWIIQHMLHICIISLGICAVQTALTHHLRVVLLFSTFSRLLDNTSNSTWTLNPSLHLFACRLYSVFQVCPASNQCYLRMVVLLHAFLGFGWTAGQTTSAFPSSQQQWRGQIDGLHSSCVSVHILHSTYCTCHIYIYIIFVI